MLIRALTAGLGAALVVAGVWFVYWPAALVVAGLGLGAVGLLADDRKPPQ